MTKLICPDCRHENEAERIYCHNCGARLDRSGIIKERVNEDVTREQTRQHLNKMFSPDRGRNKRIALQLTKVLLWSLAVATVIVVLLPPELPPAPKSYNFAPLINMEIASAVSNRQPASLSYNEEQVNSYLASTVKRRDSPAHTGFFPLRRIFVQFEERKCWIHTERRAFMLSVFTGGAYEVKKIEGGKIDAEAVAGYIGRMPIHPTLMKAANLLLAKAWDSLSHEHKSVAQLVGIEFHPQSVTLVVTR
ncbi:MAG: hypothetical protein ACR2G0_07410 [Chthoniobacterales bacterium]